MPRLASRNPHNLPDVELAALTERQRQGGAADTPTLVGRLATSLVSQPIHAVECVTCHREHRSGESLSSITNQQCQVCHANTFHSFEIDHPEFTSLAIPVERRIAFSHQAHELKHFAEKGAAYSCQQCHEAEPTRQAMRLKPFEQACADCHQSTIDVASLDGWRFLSLPGIDINAMQSAGLDGGDWPTEMSDLFDGELSATTLLLLSGDPAALAAIESLGGEVDFSMLDDGDPSELAAANEIVWGLKRLIWELASGDEVALGARLERAGARDSLERRVWLAKLPSSQLEELAAVWLPDLEFELKQIERTPSGIARTNRPVIAPANDSSISAPHVASPSPNAVLPVRAVSLAIGADQELLAENPLRGLREPAVEAPMREAADGESQRIEPEEPRNEEPAPSVTPSPTELPAEPARGGGTRGSEIMPAARRFPLANPAGQPLADNPLKELLPRDPLASNDANSTTQSPANVPDSNTTDSSFEPRESEPTTVSGASGNDSAGTTDTDSSSMLGADEEEGGDTNISGQLAREDGQVLPWRFTPERRVGWVRDDERWTLTYYPAGHDDAVLTALYSFVIGAGQGPRDPRASLDVAQVWKLDDATLDSDPLIVQLVAWQEAEEQQRSLPVGSLARLAAELAEPVAVGACAKCHAVTTVDHHSQVAWHGYRRDVNHSRFTRFSHGPHLTHADLRDCRTCHALNHAATAMDANTVGAERPDTHRSEFLALTRQDCAKCHRSGVASNDCTTCHQYHVGIPLIGRD
ncbi:MAG: hypothetical protein R3B96_08030 [Pirellulaceae bacterium]